MKRFNLFFWALLTSLFMGLCLSCTEDEEEIERLPDEPENVIPDDQKPSDDQKPDDEGLSDNESVPDPNILPNPNINLNNYFGTKQFTNDVDVFLDLVIYTEFAKTTFVKMTSNGFDQSSPLLMGDWWDYMKKNPKVVEDQLLAMEHLIENHENYKQAFSNLNYSNAFSSTDSRGPSLSDAIGVGGGILGFLGELFIGGKKDRVKFLEVYDQLDEADKQDAYNNVPMDCLLGTDNKEEWIKKVREGKLDRKMMRVYKSCRDMCGAGFGRYASNPDAMIAQKAAGLLAAGSNIVVSAGSIVAPAGVGAGAALVNAIDNVESMVKAKDAAEFTEASINFVGNTMGMSSKDELEMAKRVVGATSTMQNMAKITRQYAEVGKTPKDKGIAKVKNKNGKKGDILIAEKINPEQDEMPKLVVAGTTKGKDGEWNVPLGEGEWHVTGIDKKGQKDTKKISVEKGKVTKVNVDSANPGSENPDQEGDDPKPDSQEGFPFDLKDINLIQFYGELDVYKNTREYYIRKDPETHECYLDTSSEVWEGRDNIWIGESFENIGYDYVKRREHVNTVEFECYCNFKDKGYNSDTKVIFEFDKGSSKLVNITFSMDNVHKRSFTDNWNTYVKDSTGVIVETIKHSITTYYNDYLRSNGIVSNCPIFPKYMEDISGYYEEEELEDIRYGTGYFYEYNNKYQSNPKVEMNYTSYRTINGQTYYTETMGDIRLKDLIILVAKSKPEE